MNKHLWLAIFLIWACTAGNDPGTDYSLLIHKDDWMRHPVLGDPSFDGFTRYAKNPVQRGTPPYDWPVNGFYFEDPVTGKEFLYIGQYHAGYALNTDFGNPIELSQGCIAYYSEDRGITWKYHGPVFKDESVVLDGEAGPITFAPDVSVVYADGKYYMGFDYATTRYTWDFGNIMHGGLAVAVSDKPQGPFTIYKKPAITSRVFYNDPWLGKYTRCYAGTLIKANHQWVFLFGLDSRTYYSWGLAAMSAPTPGGPWSTPVLINSCDKDSYYPSLMEYYPAFQHNDTVYVPATSVARNRNFQIVFRVPAEEIMDPEKWELWKEGSVWHSLPVDNEYEGIWGQTFSGFIDKEGMFKVMYPSRDKENRGTINLASVVWNQPDRDSGFVLSGHGTPSFTAIPGFFRNPGIEASFSFYGTVAFTWNYKAPAGPDYPRADAELHPLMFTSNTRLELADNQWSMLHTDSNGQTDTLGRGRLEKQNVNTVKIEPRNREVLVSINNENVWHGPMNESCSGRCGLFVMKRSGMDVGSFIVRGKDQQGYFDWLYTEGISNSGSDMKDWKIMAGDSMFTYGIGAVSGIDTARAKWSFTGSGFDLYCPKMPSLGKAVIIVNGKTVSDIDLHAETPQKSAAVYTMRKLPQRKNAVVIVGRAGKIAIDCLRVYE